MNINVAEHPSEIAPAPAGGISPGVDSAAIDRRRPGRPAQVSPELVELLRWQPAVTMAGVAAGSSGALQAAQGILFSAVPGLAIWTGLAVAARHFLG